MARPSLIRPDQIRPIPDVVEHEQTTAFVLDVMDGDGIDQLPVVSPGTGKLRGVVDRTELESRCLGFHEPDRCVVRNHLRSHVPYCFEAEPLDEELLERSADEPVVVVDGHFRPIGFLQDGAGRGSIVAIDHDGDSRKILEVLLTRLGYAVETVASVDELDSRPGGAPDLVLLEPDGEADRVRRTVDLMPEGADPVPILAVTTWVDEASRDAVLEAGADRLLPKPVSAAALEDAVTEMLTPSDVLEPDDGEGGARIVVVDDDRAVRQMVSRLLRSRGYRVRSAFNGSDGVALAAAWRPDLILMDLAMPVLDGWNARRLLARGRSTAGIPVMLVTGSCGHEDRDTVLEEGFCELVRKPFTTEELLDAVETALHATPVRPGISHRPPSIPTDTRVGNGPAARSRALPPDVPLGGIERPLRREASRERGQ